MSALETIEQLARFEGRGPGTDSERRAALWFANELRNGGRRVRIETFWCRPNWALAHLWHVGLAIGASLASVASPRLGGILLLVALVSVIADWLIGSSLGRRLTPERASQNVIASEPAGNGEPPPRRLIVVANYDAGRAGVAYSPFFRTPAARLQRLTGGLLPGWLGWVVLLILWLLAAAILRLQGHHGTVIGAVQLVPTVALLLTLGLLIDLAGAAYGPAAGDNGSGAALAVALVRALDAARPANLEVELVLEGAGEGGGLGMRRYLRARRKSLPPANTIVVGIAASAAGTPRWWDSDGELMPLRYFPRLRRLSTEVAADHSNLRVRGHPGRGPTPALRARLARLPAIAIGCLDEHETVPRSHQPDDIPASADSRSLDAALQFALMLVDAIDNYLETRPTTPG